MSAAYSSIISRELNVSERQINATIGLLEEGATVPFIARYRKERTGSLDEVNITQIRDRLTQLKELDKRREVIIKTIQEQGKLTDELKSKIEQASTMTLLEDLYLPFKPKRKTRASMAREKGLEPLALLILKQGSGDPESWAQDFVDAKKEVDSIDAALAGARDIIAEMINEDATVRKQIRELFQKEAVITSRVLKGKESEAEKFKDYFDFEQRLKDIPSHRLLAIRRGEKELVLTMDISVEESEALNKITRIYVKGSGTAAKQVEMALTDAYKRLLKPSIETEMRMLTKKKADEEAIRVFAENLKQLLMAAPLGQKSLVALDPGYRTGCKVVCLDRQGNLLHNTTIFPNQPQNKIFESGEEIKALVKKYHAEAIVIGNGTASRETESFIRNLNLDILVAVVNESGASIYSASEVAREEFPDHDVTVRGAIYIGRRLMDPLAELVKIDPKSIGVGQYQHDVDQSALKKSLDDVVMNCVNQVGVELNTASKQLLTYVSGLGPQLAENIVKYRKENGPFMSRESLTKVPKLGAKAYEQAAGFLRINQSKNVLDRSAVHPESYSLVRQIAKDLDSDVDTLVRETSVRDRIDIKKYVTEEIGLPTLKDIVQELEKPGRDPREQFEVFAFEESVNEVSDLKIGMKLPGIVTNITKFGAFVDVGVHQDGLVHISQLSDSFVSDPTKAVKLQQKVMVTVTEVDVQRKRISLSMKSDPFGKSGQKRVTKPKREETQEGDLQTKLAMLKGKFGNQ
jgi:uncharacterized protein